MFSFGLGKTSLSPSLATATTPTTAAPSLAALVAQNLGTELPVTPEALGTPIMSTKKRGPKPVRESLGFLGLRTHHLFSSRKTVTSMTRRLSLPRREREPHQRELPPARPRKSSPRRKTRTLISTTMRMTRHA